MLEVIEKAILKNTNTEIPYNHSVVSMIRAGQYLKVFGPILDFSSILCPGTYIYNYVAQSPALLAKVEFLASLTKNQPFLLKDEAQCKLIKVSKMCNIYIYTNLL